MENILPRYERPIKSTLEPEYTPSFWDKAVDAFDEKDYKKSIIATINYMNKNILNAVDTSGDIHITQMQGSAEIQIDIVGDTFKITVPFLSITDKTNTVALLRKVSEVNFTNLDIEQIHINDNRLFFHHECSLATCQPNKMYDLIRNICLQADNLDDEMIENYDASFYKEQNMTPLSSQEKDSAYTQITNIFEDYKDLSEVFKEKKLDYFQWDIQLVSLLKLSNMPYLQGRFRSEIMDTISYMYDNDIELKTRVGRCAKYINTLIEKDKQEWMDSLYHAEQFITLLWTSDDEIIEERLEDFDNTVEKYKDDEDYFAQSWYLQGIFLKLIYNYNLNDMYKNAINDVLENISGLTPEKAAPKLLNLYDAMYNTNLDEDFDANEDFEEYDEEKTEELLTDIKKTMRSSMLRAAAAILIAVVSSAAFYKMVF